MGSDMTVFAGQDCRCKKKLFGLVNCRNKGGTNAITQLTDRNLGGVPKPVIKAAAKSSKADAKAAVVASAQPTPAPPPAPSLRDVSPYTYTALKLGNFALSAW